MKTGVFVAFVQETPAWNHWFSGAYGTATNQPYSGDYPDTADFDTSTDNGFGVEWTLGTVRGLQTINARFAASGAPLSPPPVTVLQPLIESSPFSGAAAPPAASS